MFVRLGLVTSSISLNSVSLNFPCVSFSLIRAVCVCVSECAFLFLVRLQSHYQWMGSITVTIIGNKWYNSFLLLDSMYALAITLCIHSHTHVLYQSPISFIRFSNEVLSWTFDRSKRECETWRNSMSNDYQRDQIKKNMFSEIALEKRCRKFSISNFSVWNNNKRQNKLICSSCNKLSSKSNRSFAWIKLNFQFT